MPGKNIVICMDGTGNEFGRNITNVVETYLLAEKSHRQLVYYDPGVGTGGYRWDDNLERVFERATGSGLHENVEQAYLYLMENYRVGDKVFLFGFSRGAFSARSLAHMLYKVGLLPEDHQNQLEYASKYYLKPEYRAEARDYREKFCRACPVHFLGVWDTVNGTIVTESAAFTDTLLNPEVSYAYHAVSIDERRKDFAVALWDETMLAPEQTVEQVWFAGVHSDVGGWYDERDLSSIALVWMVERASEVGLQVNEALLERKRAERNAAGEIHESHRGFWKLRGLPSRRKIPPRAHVHISVIERMQKMAGYRPKLPEDHEVVYQVI